MDLDIENDGDIHSWKDIQHIAFRGYKLFLWLLLFSFEIVLDQLIKVLLQLCLHIDNSVYYYPVSW